MISINKILRAWTVLFLLVSAPLHGQDHAYEREALAPIALSARTTLERDKKPSSWFRKSTQNVLEARTAENKEPAKPSRKNPVRDAVRESIFVQIDGIDFVTTMGALSDADYNVLEKLRMTPRGMTTREILHDLRGHKAYLEMALRLLEDQGWVFREKPFFFSQTRYRLTPQGWPATNPDVLQAYKAMSRFIRLRLSTIEAMDQFFSMQRHQHPLADWTALAKEDFGIDLDESLHGKLRERIVLQLQGVLAGPLMIRLEKTKSLARLNEAESGVPFEELLSAVPGAEESELRASLDYLVTMGWLQESESVYSMTASGREAATFAGSYGVPVSYLPMLNQVDELLHGDPSVVFARDAEGRERHVHRALNVWGSGASHKAYFEAVREQVAELFNRPLEEQPHYICDMGSGDGTFLVEMYDYILHHTKRGELIREWPEHYKLWVIGADFNEVSREKTSQTLARAGIPFYRVIYGDINEPQALARELEGLGRGIDIYKGLHTNTFLIHNRPYVPPGLARAFLGKFLRSPLSGVYASHSLKSLLGDYAVPNRALEFSLKAMFKHWQPLIARFGMLSIELHLLPADLAAQMVGKVMATSYHATHLYSGQYIMEVPHYLRIAESAGLRAAWHKNALKNLPGGHSPVSYTHFIAVESRKNLRTRRSVLAAA